MRKQIVARDEKIGEEQKQLYQQKWKFYQTKFRSSDRRGTGPVARRRRISDQGLYKIYPFIYFDV